MLVSSVNAEHHVWDGSEKNWTVSVNLRIVLSYDNAIEENARDFAHIANNTTAKNTGLVKQDVSIIL